MKKTILILTALVALFALGACSSDNNPMSVGTDIQNDAARSGNEGDALLKSVEAMNVTTGDFDTLIAGLKAERLIRPLVELGNTTVFAPTDAAFAALGLDETNIAGLAGLRNILAYHVSTELLFAGDVLARESITMGNGQDTAISLRDGAPYINDSMIIQTDIVQPTGVIHVIDAVLLP
ncbi:MAG: fasciclin domain-containing protein [bacterium]